MRLLEIQKSILLADEKLKIFLIWHSDLIASKIVGSVISVEALVLRRASQRELNSWGSISPASLFCRD